MIRLLIADDHAIVRKGLRHLCEGEEDMAVVAEAANGQEVQAALQQDRFDLLVLDLTMPGVSGIELVERIRAQAPALPILIFSMRNEWQLVKRMAHIGVVGYVTKGCSDDLLLSAIRKVAGGESFIDPVIAEQLLFRTRQERRPEDQARLSERELQILKLLGLGKSVKQIADELLLSSRTVSTYKSRLMQKMNFKNNAELVLYASESGLV